MFHGMDSLTKLLSIGDRTSARTSAQAARMTANIGNIHAACRKGGA
jgi:hypothetical protein